MYRIFRSTGPRSSVEISGPYNTFGLANSFAVKASIPDRYIKVIKV